MNFAAIDGDYDGLIAADLPGSGAERQRRSGNLRVVLSKTGIFTGTLTFAGTLLNQIGQADSRRYAFTGGLDGAGRFVRTIQRRGFPPIVLTLHSMRKRARSPAPPPRPMARCLSPPHCRSPNVWSPGRSREITRCS